MYIYIYMYVFIYLSIYSCIYESLTGKPQQTRKVATFESPGRCEVPRAAVFVTAPLRPFERVWVREAPEPSTDARIITYNVI